MFETPTFEQIRERILRDTKSLWPDADISPDSDHYVHASRLASCAEGQYAHQSWIVRQIFPDTADREYLERHASMRGLRRRNPTTVSVPLAV
ncbi:baseplate J/gp47 family protein, partial [Neisseria meningitidis]|nr:baseplate J/gp47 family protein [Neisseria meningitidis]